jgi:hypothetical protein
MGSRHLGLRVLLALIIWMTLILLAQITGLMH